MARDETSVLLILLIAAVALVGVALAASSLGTNQSFGHMLGGGGMMDQNPPTTDTGPGIAEWAILIASLAVLVAAVSFLFRTRSAGAAAGSTSSAAGSTATGAVGMGPVAPSEPRMSDVAAVPEPALVKLLGEDERQMYLEIRDHGGVMLQRDLVSLGVWSKAKVTRVLDKLEAKGVVVREAHGMTNRVRILNRER